MALLEVEDLTVTFDTEAGVVTAVDGLSYSVERGELFGVVGESGAGKSVAALAVLDLLDEPGRIESGSVRFDGRDLLELPERELRSIRGAEIGTVFQDPQTALDPVYTVGEQIAETIRHHMDYDRAAARERAIRLLDRVGVPEPARRYDSYPHELSGGQAQRAVVAMALSCDPDLLIADEPTTGLDVTTAAALLAELASLAEAFDVAVQLITHDLGVVAGLCDRVAVVYAGEAVEIAPVEELFYDPKHPYTVGLLSSTPRLCDDRDRLRTIPGEPPDAIDRPSGCQFHPRCPWAEDACRRTHPAMVDPERGLAADRSIGARGARCLAYTGDLEGELDYEVHVVGTDSSADEPIDGHGRGDDEQRSTGERGSTADGASSSAGSSSPDDRRERGYDD